MFFGVQEQNLWITHNFAMTGFLSGQAANISKKPVLKHLGMEFALITGMRFRGISKMGVFYKERAFVRRVI